MDDDFDEQAEADAILRVFGPSLVGRIKSGEVGVFANVETQNLILDSMAKESDANSIQPLKQIFEETKTVRARAHKLERIVSERIGAQQGQPMVPPTEASNASSVQRKQEEEERPIASNRSQEAILQSKETKSTKQFEPVEDHPPPSRLNPRNEDEEKLSAPEKLEAQKVSKSDEGTLKRSKEFWPAKSENNDQTDLPNDFVSLQDPLEYRLADRLVFMKATVRLRSMPNMEAGQVGLVDANTVVTVDGMTPVWFRVRYPTRAWVLRADAQKLPLFQRNATAQETVPKPEVLQVLPTPSVSMDDFRRLEERVMQLEQELNSLRSVLRSV